MKIKYQKSCFLSHNLNDDLLNRVVEIFGILVYYLDQGMKYLGIFLKPNEYRVNDWHWLTPESGEEYWTWTSRWISLGGKLVLVNSILQNMSVYWIYLAKVPLNIINNISQIVSRFLWKGSKKPTGFHLGSWDSIIMPKDLGGWGIQNLNRFEKYLGGAKVVF
jgi:hypothetical protein